MPYQTPLIITPTHDLPFKYVFAQPGETEELLAAFLNHLLILEGERRIVELEYRNVELTPYQPHGRRLILDLRVTDQRGVTYNVEVQRENQDPILSRALFQYSKITGDQLSARESFGELSAVVVVLLCNYSTFPDTEAIRVIRLTPFTLGDHEAQTPLPHRLAHFDPKLSPRYTHLKERVRQAEASPHARLSR